MRNHEHGRKKDCTVGTAELLVAYQAGALDEGTAVGLDRHLADCGECREFLAGQRAVWEALEACRATPAVSSSFDELLYARIAREERGHWWQRTWRRWFQGGELVNWKPVGAVAFASVAVMVGLALRPAQVGSKPVGVAEPAAVAVAFDKQEIELIDRALEDFEMINKMGAPAEEMAEKL